MKKSRKPDILTTDNTVISATSDLFIATMLSAPKNEPILRGLINAVLTNSGHDPIVTAVVLNPFNIKEFAVDKQIVLDVRVEDEFGRVFNIEIQTSPHAAFVERIMFGWADTFSAQLHAGNEYHKLRPVYCIVITEFKIFGDVGGVHLVFELRERNHPNVVLSDHLQMHFLRLFEVLKRGRAVLENISPELRHWLNFLAFGGKIEESEMSQLLENDQLLMDAVSELKRFSSDPKLRELERRRKLWKLEYYSGLAAAKEEGLAEGKVEGEVHAVLVVLRARFKKTTKEIEKKVRRVTDSAALESLAALAATCKSIDEFVKHLE